MNYTIYHLHSDLSNGVTNIDSVTKYQSYIARAKECGMSALGFSEHGSVFEWWHKKCEIEKAGMKYIHAIEMYVTESLDEKIRDNYHCVLIARNIDGVYELNRLISQAFCRVDNHFYYVPRISFQELQATSNNIIFTTACIGGPLSKGGDDFKESFLRFCIRNKDRCFLEVGHHLDPQQVEYNKYLYSISKQYGVRLIAGTDTHCLNDEHVKGRRILQAAKGIHFDEEEQWDLIFKTFDELVAAYKKQSALPEDVYMQAIENTNVMANMVEVFTYSKAVKYPHIYANPLQTFKEKIKKAAENHPYINKRYTPTEIQSFIDEELTVYEKTGAIDFMLLQTYLREWECNNGIQCGYGRGSVSGSMIAYILGITQMDSKRFNLNFFRFMNPARVSVADIDSDYSGQDRDRVKQFLLRDRLSLAQIQTSEIITFNTIATKGAIRDVGRALNMNLDEVGEICDQIHDDDIPVKARAKYKELFDYVDIVSGTVVSVGTHPSGVLVSDLDIRDLIGMCSTSTSEYQVSMLNMKELDDLQLVKLDILGLDNLGVINDTCYMAGIERLTPDNVNLDDLDVWKSIRDDTTMIFQWESEGASAYLRKFISDETIAKVRNIIPNFSMLKWLSFGNGLIRPACSSYRNEVADGKFYDNGFDALNKFLAPEMGRVCMQETIMQFLVKFCGYSSAESDNVRRAIAKKKGTETLLPEIERRFIEYSSTHYDITAEKCAEIIKPFIQIILSASDYAFSWNHSDSYSAIGYVCGYLRYYYPLEFITASLNTFSDDEEKMKAITAYANSHGIRITPPRWGYSIDKYFFNKEQNVIAKGLKSIKYMNASVAIQLYELSKNAELKSFVDVLKAIVAQTDINSRQLDLLIKIDYFQKFGNSKELLRLNDMFNFFKQGSAKTIKKQDLAPEMQILISQYATDKNAKGVELKSYTITDINALMQACEDYIRSLSLDDLDMKVKIQNSIDILGYVDIVTNRPEDRCRLLIADVIPMKSKESGNIWGYRVETRSLGTGKTARITIRTKVFDATPIKKGNIVFTTPRDLWRNDQGYWYLLNYRIEA